jgi:hypothetical protein
VHYFRKNVVSYVEANLSGYLHNTQREPNRPISLQRFTRHRFEHFRAYLSFLRNSLFTRFFPQLTAVYFEE